MDLGITYVPSTKNKVIAEINGHLYYHDYNSKTSDTAYYKCINHKKGCKARAIKRVVNGGEKVELKNVHTNLALRKCLELLQSEQHHWELETAKIASGIRKPFVRKYQQLNVQLFNIVQTYNTTSLDLFEYLKSISWCLHTYYAEN
jgi:hypothetical protein